MSDNEIIQSLKICFDVRIECDGCSFNNGEDCHPEIKRAVLDLIERQQAEIERLKQEQVFAKAHYGELEWQHITLCEALKTAKAEAIKEFVMKLKIYILNPNKDFYAMLDEIDNLVKEMEEHDERTSFSSSC